MIDFLLSKLMLYQQMIPNCVVVEHGFHIKTLFALRKNDLLHQDKFDIGCDFRFYLSEMI